MRELSQPHCAMQTPYIHFIWKLTRAFPSRPVVLIECPQVSLGMATHAVTPDVVMLAIVEFMHRNAWPRAAFVGHSYGTFVLSRLVQTHRDMVESMVRSAEEAGMGM